MANEPIPPDLDSLQRENAELREKLNLAKTNAEEYRAAAYEMLDEIFPYVPPTEEELQELVHGPRGRSPMEVLEENDARFLRGEP